MDCRIDLRSNLDRHYPFVTCCTEWIPHDPHTQHLETLKRKKRRRKNRKYVKMNEKTKNGLSLLKMCSNQKNHLIIIFKIFKFKIIC